MILIKRIPQQDPSMNITLRLSFLFFDLSFMILIKRTPLIKKRVLPQVKQFSPFSHNCQFIDMNLTFSGNYIHFLVYQKVAIFVNIDKNATKIYCIKRLTILVRHSLT